MKTQDKTTKETIATVISRMRSRWPSVSLESWKLIFEIVGIIAVGLTFLFGSAALVVGNRINKQQAAKLRSFDESLTEAKTELGKQQERAAKAELEVADAKKSAAEASRKTEGFRLDIAGANERAAAAETKAEGFRLDIAKSNERAAEAVQKAEGERLARVRIEEKLAGWKLDAPAQARIIEKLKKYAKTPFDLGANPVEIAFMETMDGVLGSAGWTRQLPKPDNALVSILLNGKARINYVSGFYVSIASSRMKDLGPAATALVEALRAEGIPVQAQMSPNEPDTTAIHLVIGNK